MADPLHIVRELRNLKSVARDNPLQHAVRIESLKKQLQVFKDNPVMYKIKKMLKPYFETLLAPITHHSAS